MPQQHGFAMVVEPIRHLASRVETLLARRTSGRILIALAGVPGSGKSTVSQALLVELSARNVQDVAIVPMVNDFKLFKIHDMG